MNLKDMFQQLATQLISDTFGSVAQTLIIRRPVYVSYDEETGAQISSHNDYTVQAIIGPWVDDNRGYANNSNYIRSDDLSAIISKQTLEINPEMDFDIAITADGTEWAILFSQVDEAEATLTLKLSKGLED
jgi:hypothetical protein